MKRKKQIVIFGSDGDHCGRAVYDIAYKLGKSLPPKEIILLTGGGTGIMEAASKGFFEKGGEVVAILPGNNKNSSNKYCTLSIPTGIGFARAQILANAADVAIVVGGGIGTRNEVNECYWRMVPIVSLPNTGGTAKDISNQYLDDRHLIKVIGVESIKDATELAVNLADNRINLEQRLIGVGLDLEIYRERPSKFIRINPNSDLTIAEIEAGLKKMFELPVSFRSTSLSKYYCSNNNNIGGIICDKNNPYFMRDYFIQDLASFIPVDLLDLKSGESVLDLCAAPGMKTMLAYDLTKGKVNITAVDNNKKRFENMQKILGDRCNNMNLYLQDGRIFNKGTYDKIIVDAPCSCEGMVVKYDKYLKKDVGGVDKIIQISTQDISNLVQLQGELLSNAYSLLKKGGSLVYSTCTINKHENEGVISSFLETHLNAKINLPKTNYSEFNLQKSALGLRVLPGKTKGIYATRIIKN